MMGKIEGISKTSSCLAIDTTPKKHGAVPKIAYRKNKTGEMIKSPLL